MMYKGNISTQNVNVAKCCRILVQHSISCGLMNEQSTKLACQEVIGFILALIGTFCQGAVKEMTALQLSQLWEGPYGERNQNGCYGNQAAAVSENVIDLDSLKCLQFDCNRGVNRCVAG